MIFSKIPVEEYWAFGIYYCPSLLVCALAITVLWVLLLNSGHKGCGRLRPIVLRCLLNVPLIIWLFYFTITAKYAFAITSLDGENNVFAEAVYKKCFNINISSAIKIAIDDRQEGNVRFYASCRIADILANNNDNTKALIFKKVADVPQFTTGFGGTNELTCGFFTPNYAEGPFTVSNIIDKRLRFKKGVF